MSIKFQTAITLSDLNGNNGFTLNGIGAHDASGHPVAWAGDANNDGFADVMVGAFGASPNGTDSGQSYVIFGGRIVGDQGTVELSCLDGNNGFKINGFGTFAYSGQALAAVGDINNDGIMDLVVGADGASPNGASSGQSYLIFGDPSLGSSGLIELSTLDGVNGFTINGIAAGDASGWFVTAAGDLNADGVDDLFVGADRASPNGQYSGQSYIIFGGTSVGNSGILQLSDLNGHNGFKINGITAGDWSGYSATAGDINTDGISDLVIGANRADSNGKYSGQSYVIFGSKDIGNAGIVQLSNLNGSNGFKINGIASGDRSGTSVSAIADVNTDGITDVIIGAKGASPNGESSGQCYVIFGGSDIGNSGTFELSSLDGKNGFIINGIAANDLTGWSVSSVGDINADGNADLIIGAPEASSNHENPYNGQSYVIFGSPCIGVDGKIELSGLDGVNGFYIEGVSSYDLCGNSVASAGDVNGDGIADVMVGAPYASVHGNQKAGQSYVIFGDTIELNNNQLSLFQGETVILTAKNLNATSKSHPANTLQFQVSALQHGRFSFLTSPHVPINQFYQQNITAAEVQFSHDGSIYPPRYNISALTGMWASTLPAAADVSFAPLRLAKNELIISQGRTALVTTNNIFALDAPSIMDDAIIFTVKNVTHGQFENIAQAGVVINAFNQAEILQNQIEFVEDGSINSPHYLMSVADGIYTLPFFASNVTFFPAPIITVNELAIKQGQSVTLDQNNLQATEAHTLRGEIIFNISSIKNGHFELLNNLGVAVTNFTQQLIDLKIVQFVQDGSFHAPSYEVSAIGKTGAISKPQLALITWVSNAPRQIDKTGRNILIGALSSAGVLGLLLISYLALGYSKNYHMKRVLQNKSGEDKQYYEETIIPICKQVFRKIKITGVMNHINAITTQEYVAAMAEIVQEMNMLGINIQFQTMLDVQQKTLVDQIVIGIKQTLHLELNSSGCCGFFKPQILPEQIHNAAADIANHVYRALTGLPGEFSLGDVAATQLATTGGYIQIP